MNRKTCIPAISKIGASKPLMDILSISKDVTISSPRERPAFVRYLGHNEHCDEKGNRQPGSFSSSRDKGKKLLDEIQRQFTRLYRTLCAAQSATQPLSASGIPNPPLNVDPTFPTPDQARRLREEVFQQFRGMEKQQNLLHLFTNCTRSYSDMWSRVLRSVHSGIR